VAQNDAEAAKWFRKAADQGKAQAQTSLGCMYQAGWGVAQNDTEAVKWFQKVQALYKFFGWDLLAKYEIVSPITPWGPSPPPSPPLPPRTPAAPWSSGTPAILRAPSAIPAMMLGQWPISLRKRQDSRCIKAVR